MIFTGILNPPPPLLVGILNSVTDSVDEKTHFPLRVLLARTSTLQNSLQCPECLFLQWLLLI